LSESYAYGITHKGVLDKNSETKPVSITTSTVYENPQIKQGSSKRPKASSVILTITVSDLDSSSSYNLYKYNKASKVPSSDFNANAENAVSTKVISNVDGTYTFTETIKSNEKVFYRCVAADATS
jgi:hypothetical protein